MRQIPVTDKGQRWFVASKLPWPRSPEVGQKQQTIWIVFSAESESYQQDKHSLRCHMFFYSYSRKSSSQNIHDDKKKTKLIWLLSTVDVEEDHESLLLACKFIWWTVSRDWVLPRCINRYSVDNQITPTTVNYKPKLTNDVDLWVKYEHCSITRGPVSRIWMLLTYVQVKWSHAFRWNVDPINIWSWPLSQQCQTQPARRNATITHHIRSLKCLLESK